MIPTIIISAVIAVIFVAIVVNEIKKKKNGTHSCSCGGNCGACGVDCHKTTSQKNDQSK